MTTVSCENYDITMQEEDGDEFKHYLQGIMNEYDAESFPTMQPPKSRRFIVRVTDAKDNVVGGAIIWIYWNWLDISLLALEKQARGQGLGRRLMRLLEDKARSEGCTKARVEAFGHQSLGFYQKLGYQIVGKLEDYPEEFDYYWMRKDLRLEETMIAYCGEVCTECSAYVATRNDDWAALQRVADEWNAKSGGSLKAEDCVCDGCLGDGRRIGYCRTCEVRACAIERGLENCAYCADYGCQKLVVCFEHSAETKVVLDGIRRRRAAIMTG